MSSSDTPAGGRLLLTLEDLHRHVDAMSVTDTPAQDMTAESASQFIADAARLYSAVCAAAGRQIAIDARAVSATQAIMLINALIQSQNLNTFDLALWQSPRGRSSTDGRIHNQ